MDEIGPKIWVRAIRGAAGRGSLPIDTFDHGRMWIDYWNGGGSFADEEYLTGSNFGWQAVYQEGKLAGSIAWERIEYVMKQVSPSGITGTTAIARLINSDKIHRRGRKTVETEDSCPTGIYGVDFKENAAGVPYVTEINLGRFYQPSLTYAAVGYDLIQLFFDLAMNRTEVGKYPARARVPENQYWLRGLDVAPVLCSVERFLEPDQFCT